uniref:RNA-dependent RNA polymerase n=1 Tax=Pyrus pyrifolia TaxID=3767 RepID=Q9ZWP7_PYRPY|nr:RNA-dependent RNA polymerase [Pyrus pyrifolia]
MEQNAFNGFEFVDYSEELENLNQNHIHKVRRESNTTYVDKFAERELIDLHPEYHRQFIQGWSRSYYNTERHMEALLNYGTRNIPVDNVDYNLYQGCIDTVKNGLRSLPRVKAFDVLTELNLVSYKSSTAAGYNYMGAKGPFDGYNHKQAIRRARATVGDVSDNGIEGLRRAITTAVPDVGYTRTQLTDLTEKTKIRNVWGRAFHYILIEGTSADPLIRMFSKTKSFYHIGRDPLDSVPDVLSETAGKARWLYAIDWKQFDATVSRFEINAAFDIIMDLIEFPNYPTYVAFELSRQLFIHKKIAAPDGYIYWSHKGIPSGSYFTSIIGSIINRLRIEYLWRKITGHGPLACYTQGDDSLSCDDEFTPPEKFAEIANQIGWVLNPEKTEYSTIPSEVHFLGRTMLGGLNTREIKRCLRLLIYPEYPVDSGRISAYRAKSISEDVGRLSELLNKIERRLQGQYGIASDEEVPDYFKRYVL